MSASRSVEEIAVVRAALGWWLGTRPVGWTEAQHLKHPRVNVVSPAGARLADACAKLVVARRKRKKAESARKG